MSFEQQVDIARRLRMDLALGPDRAFLKVQALAFACGVELRLCAAQPEGTTASPVLARSDAVLRDESLHTMVWAKRGFIFWNEAVTLENYIRWDHAPEMFAVLLHDLGHVAAGGTWKVPEPRSRKEALEKEQRAFVEALEAEDAERVARMTSEYVERYQALCQSDPLHLDVNEQGLADEDVAARWTRYAARGLWGLGSREERQMQRFDLMSGCSMPPKGPRFDPEPKPTDEQVVEASRVYDVLLGMLRSYT